MADEVTVSSVLRFSKTLSTGITIAANNGASFTVDMAGTKYDGGIQTCGAGVAEVLVVKSDFGTPKYLWMKNLNDTNFVQVGNWNAASPVYFAKLATGEEMILPITVTKDNIACLADTGNVDVAFLLIEA